MVVVGFARIFLSIYFDTITDISTFQSSSDKFVNP